MPPLRPGWYCYLAANASDLEASDLVGPFTTDQDALDWMTEWGIEYRRDGRPAKTSVFYALPGEMTDQESHLPWACCIHQVRP